MTQPSHLPVSRRGLWKTFALALSAFFCLLLVWAIAVPLTASPDEPAHAVRAAAVVRGELGGVIRSDATDTEVTVPSYIAELQFGYKCFARAPEESAACLPGLPDDPEELVTGLTSAALNSPVYYALVGGPTLVLSPVKALYAMRAISALLCAVLLAFAFTALRQLPRHRVTMIAAAIAVTPMVLFLGATINPNSIEVCAAVAFFATLLAAARTTTNRSTHWIRVGVLVLSGLLLANSRSIAMLWLLVLAVMVLLVARREILAALFTRVSTWVGIAVLGVGSLATLWWYLNPQVDGVGTKTYAYGEKSGWLDSFLTMLDRTFDYGTAWIGNLGWLDTPVPGVAIVIWTLLLAGLVVLAIVLGRRRMSLWMIAWCVILVLTPAVIQANLVYDWGYLWQGRYTLALVVCAIVAAGFALDESKFRLPEWVSRRVILAVLALLAAGHIITFFYMLRRYVVGLDWETTWVDMVLRPEWQPPLGWMVVGLAYVVVVAATLWLLWGSLPERDGSDRNVEISPVTPADSIAANRTGAHPHTEDDRHEHQH